MPLRFRITSNHPTLAASAETKEFAACGGTIGRNSNNDWVLRDDSCYVSGQHALIDFQAGAYYLIDTSRNGVYINSSDKPVGRGHPQRLFDGDRLKIGDYAIEIKISADDPALLHDGMRDSVVRAQLVPIDDSPELPLLENARLVNDKAPTPHSKASRPATPRLAKAQAIKEPPATLASDKAADVLLEAAGLQQHDLIGVSPDEILETAGQLLNGLVSGIIEMMRERAAIKDSFRLPQTMIQGQQNNPLKFSPSTQDALKYLLGDRSESYLSATEAVRGAFDDLKAHQKAVPGAMFLALKEYLEQFDPDELSLRFDQQGKRGSLLSGAGKPRYWEQYKECFETLMRSDDGRLPNAFNDEFSRAYLRLTDRSKSTRNN